MSSPSETAADHVAADQTQDTETSRERNAERVRHRSVARNVMTIINSSVHVHMQSRKQVSQALAAAASEQDHAHRSMARLNAEAVQLHRDSKHVEAVVVYSRLFMKARQNNLTHAEMYSCYNNRAASYLKLHMYQEALQDAKIATRMAELALQRSDQISLPSELAVR